jgi:uracil-DNA glycosylase
MSTGDGRHARRKLLLNELGLTPLWRVRGVDPAEAIHLNQTATEDSAVQASSRQTRTARLTVLEERRAEILRMGWEQLQASVAGCVACPLCETRSRTVFGVGDPNADWLCVGEGPGAQEDATGEPFVGPAGQLLDNILTAIDLKRGRNVFITNIVKCRPPGNREPTPEEANRCEPYLTRQVEIIRPKLIIALGKTAASNLLHTNASLASLRGRLHQYLDIPVLVTYHPAYVLRNLPAKAMVWEDLCFARSTMARLLQLEN